MKGSTARGTLAPQHLAELALAVQRQREVFEGDARALPAALRRTTEQAAAGNSTAEAVKSAKKQKKSSSSVVRDERSAAFLLSTCLP